jgi:kinesin family protein 11
MSAKASTLKETLPSLAADADIRAPLHELREVVSSQKLIEYNPTGETPQRVSYNIPSNLPRTEAHENILSRLRDRPTTADSPMRSPSKQPIFNDATNTLSLASPTDVFAFTANKPNFSHSISAHAHTIPHLPTGNPSSLRELDVNVVAQEAHTQPLPHLVSQSSCDSLANGVPPSKKMRTNGDDGSKLPMKKMTRKTVGVAGDRGDRENITNFGNSVGPGLTAGRKLRSHGSS